MASTHIHALIIVADIGSAKMRGLKKKLRIKIVKENKQYARLFWAFMGWCSILIVPVIHWAFGGF